MRRSGPPSPLLALTWLSAFLLLAPLAWGAGGAAEAVDEGVPAQETFGSWPPPELRERLYRLPWNAYALRRAAFFNRPVLFVLTVDWSRASQRLVDETLRDPEILRTINTGYITVAVNADLRPDIRERYQTGAWPALEFLIPGGQPLLSQVNDLGVAKPITTSATDKETLLFLLREGIVYWGRWTELLVRVGQTWAEREGPEDTVPGAVDADTSEWVARWLLGNADRLEGGFGASARYFAPAVEAYAGLRAVRGMPALRGHSRFTLERLLASPLYDAREGGMHRLAAGPGYEGIQYEKMLEGNALLARALVASIRDADSEALRKGLTETARYIVQVLGREEGGFHLAQGADPSSPDGGAYWQDDSRRGEAPPVDAIVLSGPNATAGAALVRTAILLDDDEIFRAGVAALDLVHERAFQRGRGVRHAIVPEGDPRVYLVAQADVALGFADAYESTGDSRYLAAARDIADFALTNLKGPQESTLRDHLPDANPLGLLRNDRRPLRPNVRLARALLRLSYHGLGSRYRDEATKILAAYGNDLSSYGIHGTEAALAIEEAISEPLTITVFGPPGAAETRALRRAAVNSPWPWTLVRTGERDPAGAASLEIRRNDAQEVVTNPALVHEAIRNVAGGGS